VIDDFGRERSATKIPYGVHDHVKEGDTVVAGQVCGDLGSAYPSRRHGSGGSVEVPGLCRGMTVTTQVDEVTGLSSTVVLDTKQRGR